MRPLMVAARSVSLLLLNVHLINFLLADSSTTLIRSHWKLLPKRACRWIYCCLFAGWKGLAEWHGSAWTRIVQSEWARLSSLLLCLQFYDIVGDWAGTKCNVLLLHQLLLQYELASPECTEQDLWKAVNTIKTHKNHRWEFHVSCVSFLCWRRLSEDLLLVAYECQTTTSIGIIRQIGRTTKQTQFNGLKL